MKKQTGMLFVIGLLILLLFLFWPSSPIQTPTNELIGTWRGGGTMEDGGVWWMEYQFANDGSYTLTTDSAYREDGQYLITERFLDGSVEVQKSWSTANSDYTHAIILLATQDPNRILLEGVELLRQ